MPLILPKDLPQLRQVTVTIKALHKIAAENFGRQIHFRWEIVSIARNKDMREIVSIARNK